ECFSSNSRLRDCWLGVGGSACQAGCLLNRRSPHSRAVRFSGRCLGACRPNPDHRCPSRSSRFPYYSLGESANDKKESGRVSKSRSEERRVGKGWSWWGASLHREDKGCST